MPAYQIDLLANAQFTLPQGVNSMVIFAASPADARNLAESRFTGDSNAAWQAATVTEITEASDFSEYALHVAVLNSVPVIDIEASPSGIAVTAGVIGVAGTGYTANDVVTLVGGTSTRAATFRVTAETAGVPDTIELVDPGEYTVAPAASPLATTGGTGSGLTITPTSSANSVEAMYANAVGLLNATSIIDASAVDMGDGTNPLLTISAISDALGDRRVLVEMLRVQGFDKTSIDGMVGTIVDEGVSGAVLSAAFPLVQVAGQVQSVVRLS